MRKTLPVLILLLGVGLVVFGATVNTVLVRVPVPEEEKPEPEPAPAPMPSILGLPELESLQVLPEETETKAEPKFEAAVLPEPTVVREVTIGGIKRNDDGTLERTYVGEPPKVCPT